MPLSSTDFPHYFFAYGTLRQGQLRDINLLRPAPTWQGRGRVRGALYDLGSYPGLLLAQGVDCGGPYGEVVGEVYATSVELERLLDENEEVWPQQTGEYCKRRVEVQMDTLPEADTKTRARLSGKIRCFTYEITALFVAGKPVISEGDWVAYRLGLGSR